MSGDFNNFKKELIEAIQRFLIQEYVSDKALKKSNKTLIMCNIFNEEIIYQLHPQLCKRITTKVDLTRMTIDTCLINMGNKQPKLQANLVDLLTRIENAEYGYNLWREVKDQLDKIPNAWFFIDSKLTIKTSLKMVLAKHSQTALKEADDACFKQKLASLLIEIQALLNKVKKLLSENALLKAEIFDLRNTIDQREQVALERSKLLEVQIEAIRKENIALIEAYHLTIKSKNSYEEECHALTVENARLLTVLEEKTAELEQSRMAFNCDESKMPSYRASLATCSSPESSVTLMRKFNNEHKNRRNMRGMSIWRERIQITADSNSCSNDIRRANAFYEA